MITEYFLQISFLISSKDDFLDYLFLQNLIKYAEVIESLNRDEVKEKLQELINFAQNILNKFVNPDDQIYKLINLDYQSLLNDDNNEGVIFYDFQELIMEYVFKKYDRVERNVIQCIEDKQEWYIIINFDICYKYYKKHLIELESFLEKIYKEKKDRYLSFPNFLLENSSKKEFIELFNKFAQKLAYEALDMLNKIDEDNYLETYGYTENIIKVAKKYKLDYHINEFEKLKQRIEDTGYKYLKKHGKYIKKEISIKEEIEKIKSELDNPKLPTEIVFLKLTHQYNSSTKEFIALITSAFERKAHTPIFDSVHHVGLEINNDFTPSVQHNLRFMLDYYTLLLSYIISDEFISKMFFNNLSLFLNEISNKYNLDYNEFNVELEGIIDAIVYLISIDESYPYYKTFCFGLSQVICSFIEKLLRKIYMDIYDREKPYIPESQALLGSLLEYEGIKKILSDKLTSILKYELHIIIEQNNTGRKQIGINLRNRLMHNYNIDFLKEVDFGLVVHTFHILIIVVHQLETSVITIID